VLCGFAVDCVVTVGGGEAGAAVTIAAGCVSTGLAGAGAALAFDMRSI
jgi:hypothetical protein